jgi:pyruvate formate-lyase activating enzyme-like uncharacterized protein
MARKHSHVRASDILKVAEEKMDRALLACSQEKADSELRKRLIDDQKKATNEFLELREELCQRITRDGAQTVRPSRNEHPTPHPGQAFCL